ncbi:MAG: S8 family serine peptidase [Bryobacterales bacterium]|nr:S8 family serine peptidase [Bryobacterales bacterium]
MKANAFGFIFSASLLLLGQTQRTIQPDVMGRAPRWAIILKDSPVAERFSNRVEMAGVQAAAQRRQIELAQSDLSARLAERKVHRLGAVQDLLNAVFISGSDEQAAEIRTWPGVEGVVRLQAYKRTLNRALDLVNGTKAWQFVGGDGNAGLGRRIGVIDTGIDQTHPAFQDSSLPAVPGGPFCSGPACDYTNRKVIAARSYVDMLAYEFADDTRPDDNSPRDRVGHGTAVAMIAAGVKNTTPVGAATGVAPKAYLGNYKVFGSPGVNDVTFSDVLITALNDAFNDGMDAVTLSLGFRALWGAADQGSTCDNSGTVPCDPWTAAIRNAVSKGMVVVAAAGNDGDSGVTIPAYNSIATPGTEASAITAGATTNSHIILQTLIVTGDDAPANLKQVDARFGDGPLPSGPLTRPARDVTAVNDNGQACGAMATGSLSGAFAVVQAGGCSLRTKVGNSQSAGADGVIYIRATGSDSVFAPSGLAFTGIPLVVVGNTNGAALRSFLQNNPNRPVTIDPALREVNDPQKYADYTAVFTSYGPNIRTSAIKPDLVAPGTDMVVGTQNYDPNSDMWSASRYTVIDGTSFSVPMVAGAAALVKQRNPAWTPAQIKSALVNTATNAIDDFDNTGKVIPAGVQAIGGGKLQADLAVQANVTVEPATISFGAVTAGGNLPSAGLTFRNGSNQTAGLRLTVVPRQTDSRARVTLSTSSFSLQPGAASTPVTVRLEGATPNPGVYEGYVQADGAAVSLRIPYLYLVTDGVPANVVPLRNENFEGLTLGSMYFAFKVVDKYGLPVPGRNVTWRVVSGGADPSQIQALRATDELGIADATVVLGPSSGAQVFEATIAGFSEPVSFVGTARVRSTLRSPGGIVNGASFETARAVAPGSWVTIFGQALSTATLRFDQLGTPFIPLSLGNVSVGVDVPGGVRQSYPARISYVSDGQVNIQLPYELQGLTSAQLKVSIGNYSSAVMSFNIADYSPAPFQYRDSSGVNMVVATQANSANVIGSSLPAKRGEYITIYANGLGPVTNQPATGEAAKIDPLSYCKGNAEVTFGGRPGAVSFCGLAPTFAGLHQVNVQVPNDAPTGVQDLIMSVNGVSSAPVKMAIQ